MNLIDDIIPTLQDLSIKAAAKLLSASADRKAVVEEWLRKEMERVTVPKSQSR